MLTIPDTLITYYLHMTRPEQFQPAFIDDARVKIVRAEQPTVAYYRFLYDSVGDQLQWRDRRLLSDADLLDAISAPNVRIDVLYLDDAPVGYVELQSKPEEAYIAYFGLFPGYMGLGLGKHLLSYALDQAWKSGARRITVNTCNLDSPAALPNYLKRGFALYKETREPMPDRYKT